jgi:hypothetical protein
MPTCDPSGSRSATILEFPAAGNSAGSSFGVGADLAILETIDAVIPVVCGKFPAVAGQRVFWRGAENFPRQAAIFFGMAGNSPSVTGVTKSSRVGALSVSHFGLSALLGPDIRPSWIRRERVGNWQVRCASEDVISKWYFHYKIRLRAGWVAVILALSAWSAEIGR